MTEQYWVVGGAYADTKFTRLAKGEQERRFGPYASEDEAREMWSGLSMAAVDDCHVRYSIQREGCAAYWVVGGKYADTKFLKLARGAAEERFGPFDKYDDAMSVWRGKAWASVDDSFSRYRIEEA
jgi:hypothetical protein